MGSSLYENIKNAVWFLHYLTQASARTIYGTWYKNKALKDYKRPSITTLRKWIDEFDGEPKTL